MSVEKMLLYFYWIYPGGEDESTLSHSHQLCKYTTLVPVSGERGDLVSPFTDQFNWRGYIRVEEEGRTPRWGELHRQRHVCGKEHGLFAWSSAGGRARGM